MEVKITQFGRLRVPVIPSLYNIVQSGGRLPRTVKIVGCRKIQCDNCRKIETNRKH